MQMSFRYGNIGVAVGVVLMIVGLAWVGFDPSDTELQIVCWSGVGTAVGVTIGLFWRDERRSSDRRP
jgi:hypothetical protein